MTLVKKQIARLPANHIGVADMQADDYRSAEYVQKVFAILQGHFGELQVPLHYGSNEQLAIAVILSAQCTDERVNQVTPGLFSKYPDMAALQNAPLPELESLIYSTGFFRHKARNIQALARILCQKYQGKIPADFETLVSLPGIGRKTANVIMNHAFGQAVGIVVDTHVKRISRLLGFTGAESPERIEKELMLFWPADLWKDLPLYLIFLGRKYCRARNPDCRACVLSEICPSAKK